MSLLGALSVLFETVLTMAAFGPPEFTDDRRLLREGQVRCGIRALKGRVHDIGTEWSNGTAHVSPGQLQFVPLIGVVGERNIDVIAVETAGSDHKSVNLYGRPATNLLITTSKGQLLWGVPVGVVDEVIARVLTEAYKET